MVNRTFSLIFLLVAASILVSDAANICNSHNFGHGSTACVCSEQHKCEDISLPVKTESGVVTSYTTSKSGARFQHGEYKFNKQAPHNKAHVSVNVDRGQKFQKIIGFGGAFTDSAGINIAKLPSDLQHRLISDYFGPGGIEYTVGRITIGGSDFSTRAYSLDDHPNDENLSKFALQEEDLKYKLPYLRMAQQVSKRQLKYFGSPWSSPAWMKTNNEINHGGFLKGQPNGKYYKLWAKYLVKFVQEYKKNNVSLWGITMENEPSFGQKSTYPFNSLGFNGTLQRDFLKLDFGPELEKSGLSHLKVMLFDDNLNAWGGEMNIVKFVTEVLSDKDAAKYCAGIAFHWYSNEEKAARDKLDVVAAHFPDHFLLGTEACLGGGGNVPLGDWNNFNRYAQDILLDLHHHASGWTDWNMVLDVQGGPSWVHTSLDAAIIVNADKKEYYKQPFYYALGHFSKFVQPDSVRVKLDGIANNENDNFIAVAFERPDKSLVLTVLNKNSNSVSFQVHDPQRGYINIEVPENTLQSLIWH